MPELSRFFGIIIRMFAELGEPHHSPHFHAYYQDEVAVYGINLWKSSPVHYRTDSDVWLKRGPNFMKPNC